MTAGIVLRALDHVLCFATECVTTRRGDQSDPSGDPNKASDMSDMFEQAKSRVLDRIQSPRGCFELKLGAALKMEQRVLQMLDKLRDEVLSEELRQQLRHHADE